MTSRNRTASNVSGGNGNGCVTSHASSRTLSIPRRRAAASAMPSCVTSASIPNTRRARPAAASVCAPFAQPTSSTTSSAWR